MREVRTVGIMVIVGAVVVRITAVLTSRQLVKRSNVIAMRKIVLKTNVVNINYLFRFLRAISSESESVLALDTVSGSDK